MAFSAALATSHPWCHWALSTLCATPWQGWGDCPQLGPGLAWVRCPPAPLGSAETQHI